jgi:arginase
VAILVPYHQDELLPDLADALPADWSHLTVVADLPEEATGWPRLVPLYRAVADAIVAAPASRVVVSGCCGVSLGVLTGLQRRGIDPGVVWFDAHGDVQTMETTTSGYLGGMPLRVMVGYRPELVADPIGLRAIPESHALLVGARDLDPPERDYLDNAAIGRSTVEDVDVGDLPPGPLLLHVDLDVVTPTDLPGLRFPVTGGPSAAAVVAAVRRICDTGRVAILDLACTWDPSTPDPATPDPSTPDAPGRRDELVAQLLGD